MTAHTPGPLDTLSIAVPMGTKFHLYIVDASGRKIGICWGKADEKMANGTLWTASPEMLTTLKWARDETDRFQSDGRIDWTEFYNRVSGAIDKAEGRS